MRLPGDEPTRFAQPDGHNRVLGKVINIVSRLWIAQVVAVVAGRLSAGGEPARGTSLST